MKVLAIIPARAHSKRLPGKNWANFRGKPMIWWSIESAKKSRIFNHIIVSTNSDTVKGIAQDSLVCVDERPLELASDNATVLSVCLDLLNREEQSGRNYDAICVLYATAPLRSAEDIRATVGLLKSGVCDFSMAVSEMDGRLHQTLRLDNQDSLSPVWPDVVEWRTDAATQAQGFRLVVGNGSTYVARVESLRKFKTFYGPKLRGYVMPNARSIDVDEQIDLDLIRLLSR